MRFEKTSRRVPTNRPDVLGVLRIHVSLNASQRLYTSAEPPAIVVFVHSAFLSGSSTGSHSQTMMIRPIFSLRPYIASSHHRLTTLSYRRLAVRPIVHRSIIHRRRPNSSLVADRLTERQGLDEREAAVLHAQHTPPSPSELGMSQHLWFLRIRLAAYAQYSFIISPDAIPQARRVWSSAVRSTSGEDHRETAEAARRAHALPPSTRTPRAAPHITSQSFIRGIPFAASLRLVLPLARAHTTRRTRPSVHRESTEGPVPLRRRRDGQDHANGPLLRHPPTPYEAQATRPLPRFHDRRAQADARSEGEAWVPGR